MAGSGHGQSEDYLKLELYKPEMEEMQMLRTETQIVTAKLTASRDTSDGSPAELPVFVARPTGGSGERRPGILLIQEVFGVNNHIQDVVKRYAAMGYVVMAPDLFYRAEPWLSFNYDQFQVIRPMMSTLTEEMVVGDLATTLDLLAAQPDVDPSRIGVIGYCFGGRLSFVSAARFSNRIKAAVIYYGGAIVGPASANWPTPPIERVAQIKCPVISFWGELDSHIPGETVRQIDDALTAASVDHRTYLYPNVDHGFFCDARASFHPRAAQDAWHRTLRFFEANLGPVPEVVWK
jgi:carboxymethylenebutenolidase